MQPLSRHSKVRNGTTTTAVFIKMIKVNFYFVMSLLTKGDDIIRMTHPIDGLCHRQYGSHSPQSCQQENSRLSSDCEEDETLYSP